MYTPAHFEETRLEVLHSFIESQPLGALVSHQPSGLTADHLPFLLEIDTSRSPFGILLCHVARPNPLWKIAEDQEVLVIFQGSNTYISPNWYPTKAENGKAVPTWNYVVVHAHGKVKTIDDPIWMRTFLEKITRQHEQSLVKPWDINDAPPDYIDRMIQGVVGIEIEITRLEGKWKMSQNHTINNVEGVLVGLHKKLDERR